MPSPSSPTPHTGFAVRDLATSLPGQTPSLPLGAALDVHRRRAAEAGGRRGESSSLWQGGKGVIECEGENRRSVCAWTRLGGHLRRGMVRRVAVAGADLLSRVCSFLLAKTGTIFFQAALKWAMARFKPFKPQAPQGPPF